MKSQIIHDMRAANTQELRESRETIADTKAFAREESCARMEALIQAQHYKQNYEDAQQLLPGGVHTVPATSRGSAATTDVSALALTLQALATTGGTTKMSSKDHNIEVLRTNLNIPSRHFFSNSNARRRACATMIIRKLLRHLYLWRTIHAGGLKLNEKSIKIALTMSGSN